MEPNIMVINNLEFIIQLVYIVIRNFIISINYFRLVVRSQAILFMVINIIIINIMVINIMVINTIEQVINIAKGGVINIAKRGELITIIELGVTRIII